MKRERMLTIRVTDDEHARLLERCEGKQLAVWMRRVCLGEPVARSGRLPTLAPPLLRQLAAIGNHLNQTARKVYSGQWSSGDRVQVVARSRSDAIYVGRICAELVGGGHAYAASASIRNLTLNEVHDAIVRNLHMQAGPEKTASDYMSSPAVGIESDRSMREADTLMMHFGLKAVPVFKPGTRRCIGILDALTASRATSHKLGYLPVDDYMRRNIKSLAPDAPLRDISSIIVGGRQRLVPIVDKDLVVGVVTRTDLINVMTSEPGQVLDYQENNSRERNVAKLLRDRLPARVRHLLELAGRLGQRLNMPVFVVGGFVRDLLLDRPNHDVDFVVEGEGVAFARALGEYGATSMIAGYTPGRTATISTTVYQLWRTGEEKPEGKLEAGHIIHI